MPKESPIRKILRIGHRGAAGHAPENTLLSIEQAIALGCDLVEVDLRLTQDGHLVLLHDKRVDRTTNGRGNIEKLALADLRGFDAGQGQPIPTLEEAIRTAVGGVGLILELKARHIGQQACTVVRRSGFVGSVIYASFVPADLQEVRSADAQAQTMALFDKRSSNLIALIHESRATHVGLRRTLATIPLVKALQKAACQVYVYTVNKPKDIERVRDLRVDGIISDFPDRI